MITPTEALTYPGRNLIVQALGVGAMNKNTINVAQVLGELNKGDSLLLCSDGLTTEVNDAVMATILAENSSAQSKVHGLIEAALAAGGKDNVTVIVVTPRFK